MSTVAELARAPRRPAPHARLVGDVAGDRDQPRAHRVRRISLRHRARPRRRCARRHHGGAGVGERARDRGADAAPAAGHERHAAAQIDRLRARAHRRLRSAALRAPRRRRSPPSSAIVVRPSSAVASAGQPKYALGPPAASKLGLRRESRATSDAGLGGSARRTSSRTSSGRSAEHDRALEASRVAGAGAELLAEPRRPRLLREIREHDHGQQMLARARDRARPRAPPVRGVEMGVRDRERHEAVARELAREVEHQRRDRDRAHRQRAGEARGERRRGERQHRQEHHVRIPRAWIRSAPARAMPSEMIASVPSGRWGPCASIAPTGRIATVRARSSSWTSRQVRSISSWIAMRGSFWSCVLVRWAGMMRGIGGKLP